MSRAPRTGVPSAPTRQPPAAPAAALPRYASGPPITDTDDLARATAALRALDPATIDHLLDVAGPPPLRRRPPGFAGLAAIVVGQQVSTASAAAILARLEAAVQPLEPAAFASASDATLRAVGLSAGKVATLRAVAAAAGSGVLDLDGLAAQPADAAHAALCSVRGIGPWTADSFLLFCLGHPDAWPAGDLALQEAARVALGLPARPGAAALEAIGERWRPWRGVAARLLWAYYRVLKGGRSTGAVLASPPQGQT